MTEFKIYEWYYCNTHRNRVHREQMDKHHFCKTRPLKQEGQWINGVLVKPTGKSKEKV